jgi:spore cortex biosynthesis protein YabQ
MTHDIYVLLGMMACAAALSMLFDLRRAFQKTVNLPDFAIIVSDFLFWIIVGVSVVWCLWTFNNGKIRIYEFIGAILGSVLYFCLLSPIFFRLFTYMSAIILKIITFIFKILLTPLRFLYKIIVVYILNTIFRKKEETTANEKLKR